MMIEKIEHKNDRRLYVEVHLLNCLKAFPVFEDVKYTKNIETKREYVRITDSVGGKCYLDITSKSESDIFTAVANIVLMSIGKVNRPPEELILDLETKKAIAPLFKIGNEVSYE